MSQTPTSSLIINSPYSAPTRHHQFLEGEQVLTPVEGRREAGYMRADPKARPHQGRGIFVPLPLVNQIRRRVDTWREAGYPGITGITKTLFEHWNDPDQRDFPFFFCQIEAIETLIWLIETSESEKIGIDIPSDGDFPRICSKLATGAGKTVVMAMLIAWQAINRATYPRDRRFSQNIFIVAPNLTVRERLAVLKPSEEKNYYDEFGIVPLSLGEKLRQAKIVIRNWHALNWDDEEKIKKKKGVDKRGAKSDEAYTREVLGDMGPNVIVINDEAHHAWRVPAESKVRGLKREDKENIEEATKWIGGLDRIHKTRRILNCFDFSATPFAPSGKKTPEEELFGWIVSDFGLNDAVESGLVKTPRVVVRDDALPNAKTYKPRLYHIYNESEVRDDLNRRAEVHEPLPDLVTNAYALLGSDWKKTYDNWGERATPPVMITVANRTETAARVKQAFDNKDILVDSLCDPEGILHIDSAVLKKAEERELEIQNTGTGESEANEKGRKLTQKERGDILREKVNTVGQEDKPGARIQNVISVGMLSEGWDARTVTHIMGLRAFTSQLLCEQVIGRGLRRASYEINEKTGHFDAEYVNVFGVPFSFLPHEEDTDGDSPPPSPKIVIKPVDERKHLAITWPNIIRIDRTYRPILSVDWEKINPLELDASGTIEIAELAPTVNNKPDLSQIKDIDLEKLIRQFRRQTMIFKAARSVWKEMKDAHSNWKASATLLMGELVRLAEQFIDSDRIRITPPLFYQEQKRRQLVIALNMTKVIRHFSHAIELNNSEKWELLLNDNHPIRSTDDMRPWRTGKPCERTEKSHINRCVFDSTWEASASFKLDKNKAVEAWVKNDHLGFEVLYVYNGRVKKYRPDFLIRLISGDLLVLETKGQQGDQDDTKHEYMREWIKAVNETGGFGRWRFAVSTKPADVEDILVQENSTGN